MFACLLKSKSKILPPVLVALGTRTLIVYCFATFVAKVYYICFATKPTPKKTFHTETFKLKPHAIFSLNAVPNNLIHFANNLVVERILQFSLFSTLIVFYLFILDCWTCVYLNNTLNLHSVIFLQRYVLIIFNLNIATFWIQLIPFPLKRLGNHVKLTSRC